MIPSLKGWPTKAKEAPSPNEGRMTPLDTNPIFQFLGGKILNNFKVHRNYDQKQRKGVKNSKKYKSNNIFGYYFGEKNQESSRAGSIFCRIKLFEVRNMATISTSIINITTCFTYNRFAN